MLPFSRNAHRTHSSTSRLVRPVSCTGQRVTRGRSLASLGKSHSCETPTTWFINPSPAEISVAAGKSETMRCTENQYHTVSFSVMPRTFTTVTWYDHECYNRIGLCLK